LDLLDPAADRARVGEVFLRDAGFGGLAAFSPRRRLVGLEGVPSLAVVRKLAIGVT